MVSFVYRAYENGALVATGRLVLEGLPAVGEQVALNGRTLVEHVVELEPRTD